MDILKFKKGLEENLPKELEKDTFYISTDTKKIRLNDSVWEDNGYLKELIYKNEKVTSLALNVLNDKINILDEVVNENEKMSSLIANDLNKKFNTLNNIVNENENVITNSIQEINLSVEENHNTINELIEIVKENEDVVSNAIVYLNEAIPTPQDENDTVTVNDKQYVYKGEDEKNIVSNLNIVTDENEAKIYAYNWGSGIQEHILPSATHDLSGVMAASDKKNLDRVNEFINEIENLTFDSLIKVTYDELVNLRNNNELIAGMKYRIIDYVTTTSQENTQSAGHQFDIIVEALNENILSENAKAIQNENDGYFDESNLEAWELKYCLDNDTSRFAWAGTNTNVVADSKNVNIIDTIITDNEFNEPFLPDYYIYIDTAGNKFNEYVPEDDEVRDGDFFIEYGRETSPDGLENQLCIYKNDLNDENYIEGGAEEGIDYADKFFYWGTEEVDGIIYDKWKKSETGSGWNILEDNNGIVYILTQRITTGEINLVEDSGKGVIYYMKDEFNNECLYDFKNIQFVRYKLNPPTVGGYNNEWQNRMSENINKMFKDNQLSYLWHGSDSGDYYWEDDMTEVMSSPTGEKKAFYTFSNVINGIVTDKSLTNVCYSNVIKESFENKVLKLNNNIFFSANITNYCNNNSFGNDCYENSIGNSCNSNSFGNDCYENSIGNSCNSNSFGNYCSYNSFGNYYSHNTFGDNCNSNSFGNYCSYNTFGDNCYYNTFGNECQSNTFGNYCSYNTFGDNCESNTFGDTCYTNTFGNECQSNTFGNYCSYNTFGDNCYYNTFGNECHSNTFGDACYTNTFGDNCESNTFGNDCYSNTFGNSCDWIAFYDDSSYEYKNYKYMYDGKTLNFISNISLGNRCGYLLFYPNSNLGTIGDDNMIKNITVTKGVNGNLGSNGLLTLEILVTNNEYELKIARNSNGDIKMYCEADLIQ